VANPVCHYGWPSKVCNQNDTMFMFDDTLAVKPAEQQTQEIYDGTIE